MVKIFVVHHKHGNVFRNAVFEPIQTGAQRSGLDLGFLRDDVGDNIADKNPYYGELTAWYWVLKNWLPKHNEVTHVGFCHYRRVLDVTSPVTSAGMPFVPMDWSDFEKLFSSERYSAQTIEELCKRYDVFLPRKDKLMSFRKNFIGNVWNQYYIFHPHKAMELCAEKAISLGLASAEDIRKVLLSYSFHSCLNFIMRRDLFESLVCWMLSIIDVAYPEMGCRPDMSFQEIRAPAYVAENFLDVWLYRQRESLRVRECAGYLVDKVHIPHDIPWYLSGVKQWVLWKTGMKTRAPLPKALR